MQQNQAPRIVGDLHSFNDWKVAFRAGAKGVKRPLVSFAVVSGHCGVVVLEFD